MPAAIGSNQRQMLLLSTKKKMLTANWLTYFFWAPDAALLRVTVPVPIAKKA